jgi:hypothetical protein
MRTLALLVVAVVLVGCGTHASAFEGSFAGTLTYVWNCSNGTGGSSSYSETWNIVEKNGTLTITTGSCDPFTATVSENVATMQGKTCPREISGGVAIELTVNGANLTLDEPKLSISARMSHLFTFSNGATVSCNSTHTGTFTRQR